MDTNNRIDQVVGEFDVHEPAERAVLQLTRTHIDVNNITIVGRDYHTEERPIGFVNTGDRMLSWGKFGAFWGTIWGILFGSAVIFIPGVGSILFAGWLVTTLVAAVEGAVIGGGLAALGGALTTVGIPKDSVIRYQKAIEAGKFLVIVRGNSEEIAEAKTILTAAGAHGLEVSEHRVLVTV